MNSPPWKHLPIPQPTLKELGFFSCSSVQKQEFSWEGKKTGNFGAGFGGNGQDISWDCRLWVQNLSGSQHINNQLYLPFPLLALSAIRDLVADEMVVVSVFICFGFVCFSPIYIFSFSMFNCSFPRDFGRVFFLAELGPKGSITYF